MAEIDTAAVEATTPETPEISNSECTEESTSIINSDDGAPEPVKVVEEVMEKEVIRKEVKDKEVIDKEVMDTGEYGLSNYELRWNDHIPYFTNIFHSLREQNELTDVTFACEDGVVGAHKLVLSSCSPYLRALFSRLGVPHPVIFLRNTPRVLVHHLMEFVYSGTVSIPEGQLAMVLNLGHSLQIQGLTMLKLTRESEDSTADEIAEEIGSEPQLLPGETRPTPNYQLHNGQEMEYDSDGNKIERPKVFKPRPEQTAVKIDTGTPRKGRPPKQVTDGNKNNALHRNDLDEIKRRKKLKGLSGLSDHKDNSMSTANRDGLMYKPSEYRVLGAFADKYGSAAAMKFASKRYGRKVGRKAIETAQRMFKKSSPSTAQEAMSRLAELTMVES